MIKSVVMWLHIYW